MHFVRSLLAAAFVVALVGCQTTTPVSKAPTCNELAAGKVAWASVEGALDGPNSSQTGRALRCAAERGAATAQVQFAEAIFQGRVEDGGFTEGLFWLQVARNHGADPVLQDKSESKRKDFLTLLTDPEREAIGRRAARWQPGEQAPETHFADLVVTFMANDNREYAGKALVRLPSEPYQLKLIAGMAGLKTSSSEPKFLEALSKIREAADRHNDAFAQLMMGVLPHMDLKFAAPVSVEQSELYLLSALRSFDPARKLSDRDLAELVKASFETNSPSVVNDYRRKGAISAELQNFLLGVCRCKDAFGKSECDAKGRTYLARAAEGGNTIAILFQASASGVLDDKVRDLKDPRVLRVVRFLFLGNTKGGLWQDA